MDVDESQFPTKFFFKNDSPEFAKCIHLWECAKAEGNLFQFYRSYKAMISKVKDGVSGRSRKAR